MIFTKYLFNIAKSSIFLKNPHASDFTQLLFLMKQTIMTQYIKSFSANSSSALKYLIKNGDSLDPGEMEELRIPKAYLNVACF